MSETARNVEGILVTDEKCLLALLSWGLQSPAVQRITQHGRPTPEVADVSHDIPTQWSLSISGVVSEGMFAHQFASRRVNGLDRPPKKRFPLRGTCVISRKRCWRLT